MRLGDRSVASQMGKGHREGFMYRPSTAFQKPRDGFISPFRVECPRPSCHLSRDSVFRVTCWIPSKLSIFVWRTGS